MTESPWNFSRLVFLLGTKVIIMPRQRKERQITTVQKITSDRISLKNNTKIIKNKRVPVIYVYQHTSYYLRCQLIMYKLFILRRS